MRRAAGYVAFVAGVCLILASAGATPASADPNSPGNNGTIAASGSASTGVVAGVQSAPQAGVVAGVENLPSTSTDTGQTPLVALGIVILATGVVLLRRPPVVPSP